MTYALIGDEVWSDPIMTALSSDAWRLYWCAVSYSSDKLTDGMIEQRQVDQVAAVNGLRRPARLTNELVQWGLWKTVRDSFEIVGFLDHNPSREKVMERRAQNAERVKRHRENHPPRPRVIQTEMEPDAAS